MKVKVTTHVIVILFSIGLPPISVKAQGVCGESFNQTKGELITPGFPRRLDFNSSCISSVSVNDGRIKWSLKNVSLPKGSVVGVDGLIFTVGDQELESKVLYSRSSSSWVLVFIKSYNASIARKYKGVRVLYEKISNDVCKYTYRTEAIKPELLESPGYPGNYTLNSTCWYFIETLKGNRVHVTFSEFLLTADDVMTFYDGIDDTILARYNGTPSLIKSVTSNSESVRVVFRSHDKSSSNDRRFVLNYRTVAKGSCLEEYYGESGSLSSANKSCVFVIRVPAGRIELKFENLSIAENNLIIVTHRYSGLLNDITFPMPADSGPVKYIIGNRNEDSLEVKFNSSAKFKLTFKQLKDDVCKYAFKIDTVHPRRMESPGYPGNYTLNSTCWYFIRTLVGNRVHIAFSVLSLPPGDVMTFYDGKDDSILARYNGTPSLTKSVTSNSESLRVVFRSQDKPSMIDRRFVFSYRKIAKGSCLEEYYGESGSVWSANKSCVFIVRIPTGRIDLKFENLSIAENSQIIVTHNGRERKNLMPADSGLVKYIAGDINEDSLEVKFDWSAKFKLTFMELKPVSSINLSGERGVITSPHFPQSYPSRLRVEYHVRVGNGHVKLNFTELRLSRPKYYWLIDFLKVYDGKDTSAQLLATYTNNTVRQLPVIISSNTSLTVEFRSYEKQRESTFQFRAVYSRETKVKYCKPLNWPHAEASRNLTIPGWTTKYRCKEDYIDKDNPYSNRGVDRVCNFNGSWEPGEKLDCARRCQPLDESLKVNSSLTWIPSSSLYPFYVGRTITFYCGSSWRWELIGAKEITCTSYGNYSGSPPTCRKRPEKDSGGSGIKPWVIGASAGGLTVILSIVLAVLRVCFGCFTCMASSSGNEPIELSQVNPQDEKKQ